MGVILPSAPPAELLAEYVETAMQDAAFVIFVEDGTYFGEIYGFDGVWATPTLSKSAARNLRKCWKAGYCSALN